MLGVGASIWNRSLAGKGDGSGGNAPSGSYLFTESFTDAENTTNFTNTRATDQYVTTDTGALFPVPAGAIPIQNARPAYNLAASGDTPSTQNITVVVGRIYAVRIGAESASGATAVCSNAFTGTLTGDAADPYALNGVATTTTLTVTITGSIRKLQVQDITHRSALSTAPDEYVDSATDHGTGVNGFAYFTTALANTVDGSGVVTEATGAALSGISLANVPGATNLCTHSADFANAAWTKSSATVIPDTAVAPDGATSSDQVDITGAGGYARFRLNGATDGASYTFSCWVKAAPSGSATHIRLTSNNTLAWNTGGSTKIALTTSWQRVSVSWTNSGTSAYVFAGAIDAAAGNDADCLGKMLVWGAQLETGTIPTPYIPTSGSTASTDAAVLDFSGVDGFVTPNETRVVATGLNASLEPDPTDTTERNVDVDDWDGTDLSDILPHANIKSVTVYAPGDRP